MSTRRGTAMHKDGNELVRSLVLIAPQLVNLRFELLDPLGQRFYLVAQVHGLGQLVFTEVAVTQACKLGQVCEVVEQLLEEIGLVLECRPLSALESCSKACVTYARFGERLQPAAASLNFQPILARPLPLDPTLLVVLVNLHVSVQRDLRSESHVVVALVDLLPFAVVLHALKLDLQQVRHLDERDPAARSFAFNLDRRVVKDSIETVIHVSAFFGYIDEQGEERLFPRPNGLLNSGVFKD